MHNRLATFSSENVSVSFCECVTVMLSVWVAMERSSSAAESCSQLCHIAL